MSITSEDYARSLGGFGLCVQYIFHSSYVWVASEEWISTVNHHKNEISKEKNKPSSFFMLKRIQFIVNETPSKQTIFKSDST